MLKPGTRIEIHPALSAWMMGDRFGKIVKASTDKPMGCTRYRVKMDKSGRTLGISDFNVHRVID